VSDGVRLSWEAASDPSGIASYQVFRDGLMIDTVTRDGDAPEYVDATPTTPSSTHAYWLHAVDGAGNISARSPGASIAIPPQEAGIDDPVDDDDDGWLETSYGFRVRAAHPRMTISPEDLESAIARMYGPEARDPYKTWFANILSADSHGPMTAALAYRATGEQQYLDEVEAHVQDADDLKKYSLLQAVDLVFEDLSTSALQKVRLLASDAQSAFGAYNLLNDIQSAVDDPTYRLSGQHSFPRVKQAVLYAGIFALTEANQVPVSDGSDPFSSMNMLRAVHNNAQPEGGIARYEARISGDLELRPDHLPGTSYGGVYDNLSYDASEESASVWFWIPWAILSGQPRYRGAYHEEFRGQFWTAMRLPYSEADVEGSDRLASICEAGQPDPDHEGIFTATSRSFEGPKRTTRALLAWWYQDPMMQYYVAADVCGRERGRTYELLYFDDALPRADEPDLPLANYFAGPGVVTTRSAWTPNATLGVFLAGQGYGRRYEDPASFMVYRQGPVVVHASKRARPVRNPPRENAHSISGFWFYKHGAGHNLPRIYDPTRTVCGDPEGRPLVASDSLGGPRFALGPYATEDGVYDLDIGGACPGGSGSAEVIRFETGPDYRYALADGTATYDTLDKFERAMVHVSPDVFFYFDRLQVKNPDARRVWTAHMAVDPLKEGAEQEYGFLDFGDQEQILFSGDDEVSVQPLFPTARDTIVRGGTTVFSEGALASGDARTDVVEVPTPRWLVIRGDVEEGEVKIAGVDEAGESVQETVRLDDSWVRDEIGGYAGNTVADFASITRVEALDDFESLSVVIPHRYDTPDITGRIGVFEPGRYGYETRPDARRFGRHTMEVEALDVGSRDTNFLVAVSMADPEATPERFELAEGDGLVGAVSGRRAWVFVKDRASDRGSLALPSSVEEVTVFGLGENAQYGVEWSDTLSIEPADGGRCATSSGVLTVARD
jgi:hypothetical protein